VFDNLPKPKPPTSKRQEVVENLTWSSLWAEKEKPLDIGPQIEQEKGQSYPKETQVDAFGSSASPYNIHHAIAGFDGKAAAIFLKDLSGWQGEVTDDHISKATEAMTLVVTDPVWWTGS
jgi:hypothetical protein